MKKEIGKIPMATEAEWEKAVGVGVRKEVIYGHEFNFLNRDPKPYGFIKY